MKRFIILAVLLIAIPAHAANHKLVAGVTILSVGTTLVFGAFHYDASCPAYYSTVSIQGYPTQCVYVGQSGISSHDLTTSATLKRPKLLYSGIAVGVVGAIMTIKEIMPKPVRKIMPDLIFSPSGWGVSRTMQF